MNDTDNTALKEDLNNVETLPEEVVPARNQPATVHVKFIGTTEHVQIKSKATGEMNKVAAANKKIRLIHGRLYFIPVDQKINSDEYGNIKQYSETSDKFEVLYVKDGVACIDTILHNALIEDGQRICIIW